MRERQALRTALSFRAKNAKRILNLVCRRLGEQQAGPLAAAPGTPDLLGFLAQPNPPARPPGLHAPAHGPVASVVQWCGDCGEAR